MMLHHKAVLHCLILVIMLVPSVHAEDLSERQVEQFISTLPELRELGEEYRETEAFSEMGSDIQKAAREGEFRPMEMMVERLADHEMFSTFTGVISEHGFEDPGEWARTGDRVMRAMMAIQMESQDTGKMKRQIEAMMERLEKDSSLSADQRKRMKRAMESAMAGMQIVTEAPEADIEVVRPHRDRLQKAMGD